MSQIPIALQPLSSLPRASAAAAQAPAHVDAGSRNRAVAGSPRLQEMLDSLRHHGTVTVGRCEMTPSLQQALTTTRGQRMGTVGGLILYPTLGALTAGISHDPRGWAIAAYTLFCSPTHYLTGATALSYIQEVVQQGLPLFADENPTASECHVRAEALGELVRHLHVSLRGDLRLDTQPSSLTRWILGPGRNIAPRTFDPERGADTAWCLARLPLGGRRNRDTISMFHLTPEARLHVQQVLYTRTREHHLQPFLLGVTAGVFSGVAWSIVSTSKGVPATEGLLFAVVLGFAIGVGIHAASNARNHNTAHDLFKGFVFEHESLLDLVDPNHRDQYEHLADRTLERYLYVARCGGLEVRTSRQTTTRDVIEMPALPGVSPAESS